MERFAGMKTPLKVLLTTASALVAGAGGAYAQDDDDVDRIVVVGSSIGVSTEQIESQALPIDVLGFEEISEIGQFTVADVLRNQPAFLGSNSANVGDGGTRSTIGLRGIGDQYTLTLIDGKRFSVNGPGNVTMIPPAALERVEVLKAGASSIYGSDAVAGVVNFVMKDNQDGAAFNARYGAADGWEFQNYTFSLGGGNDDTSFFFLADYYTNTELRGIDRREFISNDRRALGGTDGRSPNQNPAQVFVPSRGGSFILDYDRFGRGQSSLNPNDYRPFNPETDFHDRVDPCRDNGEVCRGQQAFAPTDRYSVVFNAKHRISDLTQIKGSFIFNRTDTQGVGGVSTGFFQVPEENFWNPFGEDVFAFYRPFAPPFDTIGGTNLRSLDSLRGTVQIDHELSDTFNLSVSANAFREEENDRRPNRYILDAFNDSLALTGPESINVFCNFCNTAEQYEGILTTTTQDEIAELYTLDARVNGEAFSLPGGPVQVVAGMNFRREEFEIRPDALTAAGAILDSAPVQAEDLSRNVFAGFAEARVPLLAPAAGSSDPRLELGVALRYEEFSDAGGTFDPLVSLKGHIIPDQLIARASWNTSFRAPQLEDLAGAQVFSELRLVDPTVPNTAPPGATPNNVVDVQGISGGNPNLEPEDAETISVGFIFTPEAVPGLFFSVDWWRLEQSNVIIAPQAFAVIAGAAPGVVRRGPGIGTGGENVIVETILINAAQRVVDGFDFTLNYTTSVTDDIDFFSNFGATYQRRFDAEVGDGEGLQSQQDQLSPIFGSLPDFRFVSSAGLESGPVKGLVEVTYIDNFTESDFGVFEAPRNIDSIVYVDLQGSYRFDDKVGPFENATLTLGVENIANEQPSFIRGSNFFDRSFSDIRGRWWYANIGVNF